MDHFFLVALAARKTYSRPAFNPKNSKRLMLYEGRCVREDKPPEMIRLTVFNVVWFHQQTARASINRKSGVSVYTMWKSECQSAGTAAMKDLPMASASSAESSHRHHQEIRAFVPLPV